MRMQCKIGPDVSHDSCYPLVVLVLLFLEMTWGRFGALIRRRRCCGAASGDDHHALGPLTSSDRRQETRCARSFLTARAETWRAVGFASGLGRLSLICVAGAVEGISVTSQRGEGMWYRLPGVGDGPAKVVPSLQEGHAEGGSGVGPVRRRNEGGHRKISPSA